MSNSLLTIIRDNIPPVDLIGFIGLLLGWRMVSVNAV